MRVFKALFLSGLIATAMCLALFAQEPQGAPAPAPGAPVPAVPGAGGDQGAAAPAGARGGPGGPGGGPGGGPRGGRGGGGGGGGAARGGGGGAKNVQVLQGAPLPETMQSFVMALGLLDKGTCSYCHVEDRSSDEKMTKLTARRMVTMVRAINESFADGKQHVTCYTCHRGSTTPLTAPAP